MPSFYPAKRLALLCLLATAGCQTPTTEVSEVVAAEPVQPSIRFVDIAAQVGLDAFHQVSGKADKLYLPAATGAGVALFDYDQDDDLDVFLINGSQIGGFESGQEPTNRLFRNEGRGTAFVDVTAGSGLESYGAWGMGCAVADVNGDGTLDLYVTNYENNAFYLNRGDGTFENVAQQAGVDSGDWSTGAAFFDYDRDGDLDLYVANFVRYDQVLAAHEGREWLTHTWKGLRVASGPMGLPASSDQLFRNDSISRDGISRDGVSKDGALDGSPIVYTEVTEAMGIATPKPSYGFQPTLGDYDDDGFVDLFVANDSRPNFLWRNLAGEGFRDNALALGVAYDRSGQDQACMGVAFDDHNGDGALDLFVTNFADELNTLYVGDGNGFFYDDTVASGLVGSATQSNLAWGTFFFDCENDGDLDLFVANGHVYPQADTLDGHESYAQTNELFEKTPQGRFREVSTEAGSGFEIARVSRGAAFGDLDDDGDLDIVINNLDDTPTVLRNDSTSAGHWLKVRLRGAGLNPTAIGARIRVETSDGIQSRTVRSSESYLSHHDLRLHFGLGTVDSIDQLVIDWPDGTSETLPGPEVNVRVVIEQGRGIVASRPSP